MCFFKVRDDVLRSDGVLDVRRLPHARASAYEGFLGQLNIWTIALRTRQKGKRLHIHQLVFYICLPSEFG